MLSEAEKEKRRAAWTPERREAQRQRTAQNGIEGPAAVRKYEGVTGTMAAIEAPDRIESVAPNLREMYLLALLKRDAKIWHQAQHEHGRAMSTDDDFLTPQSVQKVKPHAGEPPAVSSAAAAMRKLRAARRDNPKPGRPVSLGRATAIAIGDATYKAEKPCKMCGGYVRYTKSCNCVACSKGVLPRNKRRSASAATRANIPRLTQYRHMQA